MTGSEDIVSITLGDLRDGVEARLRSGRYTSVMDVLRAALRALDREEKQEDEVLRRKVAQALADPSESLPAEQVFSHLRARRAARVRTRERGL